MDQNPVLNEIDKILQQNNLGNKMVKNLTLLKSIMNHINFRKHYYQLNYYEYLHS